MEIVTGDRYLESLVKFVENNAERLIEGTLVLKLNPAGLRYVQSRLEALAELEALLSGAPVDYLRAYVSDLGDHRALEQLRRILRLLPSLKVVSVLPPPGRDPTPLSLLPFGRLKVLELRGCDLSTTAARGLLELRHTLEKLVCHNSTDALRHVFASRIAEIKNSPQWNRLSFVSCAFNGLLLMDESLQLLPAMDTLDLSSNKFAKVDNLRKCTKLKHLDLGFNHLRTISSFSEVSCQIVKLVLRNNALTTLRGIQNLKSLEGLDVSYNIIFNFLEIEILACLPSLRNLWFEGNPLCCARWYRAQVFSYFPFPDNLILDEKKISTREFWVRQIIIASRQKHPSSFGFYSPAKDGAELDGSVNTKRKRISRLASIESEDESIYACSDQDSVSCDNEIQSKEEDAISDEEAEIVDLMNRIELMKKEHEFKEWMDPAGHNFLYGKCTEATLSAYKEQDENNVRDKHHGETSRYILDSVQVFLEDGSRNNLESDNSFADAIMSSDAQILLEQNGEGSYSIPVVRSWHITGEHMKPLNDEGRMPKSSRNPPLPGRAKMIEENISETFTLIPDIVESQASSVSPGSPPHYQDDILQRRHNLEEEFLQLSAVSSSVVSSDSNTSCSEEDSAEFGSFIPQVDQSLISKFSERSEDDCSSVLHSDHVHYGGENEVSASEQNGLRALAVSDDGNSGYNEIRVLGNSSYFCRGKVPADVHDGDRMHFVKHESDWLEKKKQKRKSKRRVISLLEEHDIDFESEPFCDSNGNQDIFTDDKDERRTICHASNFSQSVDDISTSKLAMKEHSDKDCGKISPGEGPLWMYSNNPTTSLTGFNLADFDLHGPCRQFVHCRHLLQEECGWMESEVVILLSSENKLYVLLVLGESDGSVPSLQLMGSHGAGDVREVFVGLGLQIVRLCCKETTYFFITRSVEISRKLLDMLDSLAACVVKNSCPVKSLEQIQADIFERDVCGGSKISIFQYSMVLFWSNNLEEDVWLSRSLFVLEQHLFVCIEDLKQFSSLSENTASSYFFLDSSCSIIDVSEMVIDTKENQCVTLELESSTSEFFSPEKGDNTKDATLMKGKPSSCLFRWKLKWFSEESLYKFVSLLKAIHSKATTYPLRMRYIK